MEWIKFEDEQPKEGAFFIGFAANSEAEIDQDPEDFDPDAFRLEFCYRKNGKYYIRNNGDYVDGGYGQDYKAKVSHWMPLPPPPSE
jgi:hypothetical protein